MSINFGGLATGLDTKSLISALMQAERRPIERMERDKKYQSSRLDAFKTFDQKLKDLRTRFEALNSSDKVRTFTASAATEEFFSLSSNSLAAPGSFHIEVKNLAQVQKNVSPGYDSVSEKSFGTGTITINGKVIAYDGDSLGSLRDKINAANKGDEATGVSASIINDGITGFRLVLTGKDGQSEFTAFVNETSAGAYVPPNFLEKPQSAKAAEIVVDGITIQSKNNIFDQAIPGVTLTLNKANAEGVSTTVTVETDKKTLKEKVQGFINAYNEVVNFIGKQSDAGWGKDAAFRSAQRRLQDFLTSPIGGDGTLQSLSQLGIQTEKNGTLKLNSSTLDKLIDESLDEVEKLFVGGAGVDGISKKFGDYLKGVTDFVDGIYASRKKMTASNVRKIDLNIERQEARLEQREKTIKAQFDALETLVSSLGAQSNFLSQQINQWNRQK